MSKEININFAPFYVGQKVICVKETRWFSASKKGVVQGPKKNEKCTVSDVIKMEGYWLIQLKEHAVEPGDIGFHYLGLDGQPNFLPAEQMKFPLVEYKKVLEEVKVSSN